MIKRSKTANPSESTKMSKIIEKELSYELGGIFFKIQGELGRFCRERQYGDALEQELSRRGIKYKREQSISVGGRESNIADFIIEDRIIVDLKAKPFVNKSDYYQMKRYLEAADGELGLIVNFQSRYLKPKRVLNAKLYSGHSDKFGASDRSGFTLIELMIAAGLFVVLISLASGAFINTLRTQRIVTDLSESMNNVSFAIEQIAREVRVGFQFSGGNDRLQFVNSSGDNVTYRLLNNGIEKCENVSCEIITTPDVNIDNLEFILQGEEAGDGEPPRVTILISVIGEKDISVDLQTTISSRVLDS